MMCECNEPFIQNTRAGACIYALVILARGSSYRVNTLRGILMAARWT